MNAWTHFKKRKLNLLGLMLVLFLFLLAIFAPLLANSEPLYASIDNKVYFPLFHSMASYSELSLEKLHDSNFQRREEVFLLWAPIPFSPFQYDLDAILEAPSSKHFLGTDEQGRDVAARLIYGARISLSVGFIAVGIYVLIGIFLGALAGYFGSLVDGVISRVIEVVICFPTFFLILTVLALVGPSIYNVMIVIGLTGWTGIARLLRGEFLKLRETDFVLAAKALGASSLRTIFRHILPNALTPVFVSATFGIASAILTESALSFLGLGVQPPDPSWGHMLSNSRDYIDFAWWLALFPGLAIFLTILSFNLVGEGLRDALDPRGRAA
ncbi:MAG: ABC transporter permease [Deltaproteobacteria bacterium]|nr:ABC transporter permease [Deltaproteobacteria bacterium]